MVSHVCKHTHGTALGTPVGGGLFRGRYRTASTACSTVRCGARWVSVWDTQLKTRRREILFCSESPMPTLAFANICDTEALSSTIEATGLPTERLKLGAPPLSTMHECDRF